MSDQMHDDLVGALSHLRWQDNEALLFVVATQKFAYQPAF